MAETTPATPIPAQNASHRPAIATIGFITAGLVLSSCGVLEKQEPPPPCPRVSIIGEAAKVAKFRPGSRQDLTELLLEAELTGLGGECIYDNKGVTVDLKVYMTGVRGPADTTRMGVVDYFIAIVGPSRDVLAKETLGLRFDFTDNRTRVPVMDEVEQRIPLQQRNTGPDYEILVGFQLTPEEIERARQRRGQ